MNLLNYIELFFIFCYLIFLFKFFQREFKAKEWLEYYKENSDIDIVFLENNYVKSLLVSDTYYLNKTQFFSSSFPEKIEFAGDSTGFHVNKYWRRIGVIHQKIGLLPSNKKFISPVFSKWFIFIFVSLLMFFFNIIYFNSNFLSSSFVVFSSLFLLSSFWLFFLFFGPKISTKDYNINHKIYYKKNESSFFKVVPLFFIIFGKRKIQDMENISNFMKEKIKSIELGIEKEKEGFFNYYLYPCEIKVILNDDVNLINLNEDDIKKFLKNNDLNFFHLEKEDWDLLLINKIIDRN